MYTGNIVQEYRIPRSNVTFHPNHSRRFKLVYVYGCCTVTPNDGKELLNLDWEKLRNLPVLWQLRKDFRPKPLKTVDKSITVLLRYELDGAHFYRSVAACSRLCADTDRNFLETDFKWHRPPLSAPLMPSRHRL